MYEVFVLYVRLPLVPYEYLARVFVLISVIPVASVVGVKVVIKAYQCSQYNSPAPILQSAPRVRTGSIHTYTSAAVPQRVFALHNTTRCYSVQYEYSLSRYIPGTI